MTPLNVPTLLEDVFNGNFSHEDAEKNRYDFYNQSIGDIHLKDGKIVACDPFAYYGDAPFEANFPVGRFPVELAIAKIADDERIGFARIKFSNEQPVKWSMAVLPGEDVSTLDGDRIFGYGVDYGTGCFIDTSAIETFTGYIDDATGDNFNKVSADMQATFKNTRSWLLWKKDEATVPMFTAGWGDGSYATYIGYDENNAICRLVTDFALFHWPA